MTPPKEKPKAVFKSPQGITPTRRTRSSLNASSPDADKKPKATPEFTPPLKSILKKQSSANTKSKSKNPTPKTQPSQKKVDSPSPAKILPYTPRTSKPRLQSKRFDPFHFKGPMPEKMYFAKISIPEEQYRAALAFLVGKVDDKPTKIEDEQPTKIEDEQPTKIEDEEEKTLPLPLPALKEPLNELYWRNCNSRSRTALEQLKPEQFPLTECTSFLIELNACLLTEDFKHLSALLSLATKMTKVGWHKKTLFKFAFAALLYDPLARRTDLLLSFLQGCLGCKFDDHREFMRMLSQGAEVIHMARTPSDRKRRRDDNEVLSKVAKKSRVCLDFDHV